MEGVVKEQAAYRRGAVTIPRVFKNVQMRHLGTELSAGLDDLRGLLQPKRFYERFRPQFLSLCIYIKITGGIFVSNLGCKYLL